MIRRQKKDRPPRTSDEQVVDFQSRYNKQGVQDRKDEWTRRFLASNTSEAKKKAEKTVSKYDGVVGAALYEVIDASKRRYKHLSELFYDGSWHDLD